MNHILDTVIFINSKIFRNYHYKDIYYHAKGSTICVNATMTIRFSGKKCKLRIFHQCCRGWRCDNTSKYFHFLRNNDVWIFKPIEMNILQLQMSQVSPSKEAYLLMKMRKFTCFLKYKFTKRCFKSVDLPFLLLEQHLYLFYMFILCINQSNHLSFCGKSRNTRS